MIARTRAIDRTGSTGERDVGRVLVAVDPDVSDQTYATLQMIQDRIGGVRY